MNNYCNTCVFYVIKPTVTTLKDDIYNKYKACDIIEYFSF